MEKNTKEKNIRKKAKENITSTIESIKKAMLKRVEQEDIDGLLAMHADCLAMMEVAYDTKVGKKMVDLFCEEVEHE